jgi:dTDP-4-amino-4,6-dideoxygalactose transaminase
MRSIRAHGKGDDKYDIVRLGMNGRLDTIQAAILIEKLAIFPEEVEAREAVARRYTRALRNHVNTPTVPAGTTSVWAQYTVTIANRDGVAAQLAAAGVPTAVYYPRPLHHQTAYRHYPVVGGSLFSGNSSESSPIALLTRVANWARPAKNWRPRT